FLSGTSAKSALALLFETREIEIPFLIRFGFECPERTCPLHLRSIALEQGLLVGSPAVPAPQGNEPSDSAERRKSKRFAVSASAEVVALRTSTRLNGPISTAKSIWISPWRTWSTPSRTDRRVWIGGSTMLVSSAARTRSSERSRIQASFLRQRANREN